MKITVNGVALEVSKEVTSDAVIKFLEKNAKDKCFTVEGLASEFRYKNSCAMDSRLRRMSLEAYKTKIILKGKQTSVFASKNFISTLKSEGMTVE